MRLRLYTFEGIYSLLFGALVKAADLNTGIPGGRGCSATSIR
jgi:hypothetical protein